MRNSPLDALFPRSRRGILCVLLGGPSIGVHLSEIARRLGVSPSSLQRELAALCAAGILVARRDGNRVSYAADESCPFLPELRGLVRKTAGLAEVLREALAPLEARIDVAFVHGSMARGAEGNESDVDLLVVGSASPREISRALSASRAILGREVNPAVFTRAEFVERVREGRAFPCHPLEHEKVFVLGTARELEELARAAGRGGAASRSRRDPRSVGDRRS
jgi:predicted nucleotidyltransferase